MSGLELRVVSVNIAMPRAFATENGEQLISAFHKRPISQPEIGVGTLGLAGDAQADTKVHGGADQAVYAYPKDHWGWWEKEKQFSCAPGFFAENLTVEGADETVVCIGDRFQWGEVLLEISQPRTPCHKFQRFSGRQDASALMTLSGRCGWHFRVLVPGVVTSTTGRLIRVLESRGPSVREIFQAGRKEWAGTPGLSQVWRQKLLAKS